MIPVASANGDRVTATNVHAARVRPLLDGSVANLLATWNPRLALFPFSSRLDGSTIRHDYAHPIAVRYTINSLLGLVEAAGSRQLAVSEEEVRLLAESFLTYPERIKFPADQGLATVLRCAVAADGPTLRACVRTLANLRDGARATSLDLQSRTWILWGACAAARYGITGARSLAAKTLSSIRSELVHEGTGLPRHATARYRRHLVSFGSLVYFLRSTHEAAVVLADEDALRLFEHGVARALALQGPSGEWPWMIDNRSGRVVDPYPIFAVHQDSMAMLFLHPAQDQGIPGAGAAIARSLAWVFGENELGRQMFADYPFFAYRSIERSEGAPRLRRYLRSITRSAADTAWQRARYVRVNAECRSYHLGWLLFAWSKRLAALETKPIWPAVEWAR